MKQIIALWHFANKGKTNTLRKLGNMLLSKIQDNDIVYCDKPINGNGKLPENGDFILVVKFRNEIVGIASEGDPYSDLKGKLEKLIKEYDVKYLFCATRTKGQTVVDVYTVAKEKDFKVLWTSTYQSDRDMEVFNELKAKHLLDLLEVLIGQ